jgi:hypothetical protein
MRQYSYYILLFSLAFFYGCHDAPHDNPLDPQSPGFISTAGVMGTVTVLNQNTPLVSAMITSKEDGISTISDASGSFSFNHLTIGTQTLICSKFNYTSDTQHIVLQTQTTPRIHFTLNGAPYAVSQNIYTRKIDQYYPSPQYFVDITTSVSDPNGITDIDSVWFAVTNPSGGFIGSDMLLFPMIYDVSSRLFKTTIYKYDLPSNTIQWLVNKPLQIRSRDFQSAISYSFPFFISRVIEDAAVPTYPAMNTTTLAKDTTGSTPLLKWSPPDVTFNYTYSLTISRTTSGIRNEVWSTTQVSSLNNEFQFPGDNGGKSLESGDYVWTISIVDDFGNYSRSKEASFVVK